MLIAKRGGEADREWVRACANEGRGRARRVLQGAAVRNGMSSVLQDAAGCGQGAPASKANDGKIKEFIVTRLRLPWWATLALGVVCALVGALLIVRPFQSLWALLWLIIGGLLLSGVHMLFTDEAEGRSWPARLVGLILIGAALTAALWPGLTLRTLAWCAGAALLAGGLIKIGLALFGKRNERLILGLRGLAHAIFGALALTLPAVTVLLLAIVFGGYVTWLGIRQITIGLAQRPSAAGRTGTPRAWPYTLRLSGAVAGVLLALGAVALVTTVRAAQPGPPGPFYALPEPLPAGAPGAILRSEPVPNFFPGATTYKVLYLSTGYDGAPTAVSGLVIIPAGPPPPEGRKVVAWTHGTVGVASNCSPSLIEGARYGAALPGLEQLIAAGYVVTATDYQGLGTPGPHPYLVGASAAANALDNVRAAINLPEAAAGNEFVVWGESQGGHSALFTGQAAANYAPELNLRGVIASAPASDLVSLFQAKTEEADPIGNILISMALVSWAEIYGIGVDEVIFPAAMPLATSIAASCIQNMDQIQFSIPAATLLNMIFLRNPPWELAPWDQLLAENTPGAIPTNAPILIAQGDADEVIAPDVQARFAQQLCAVGNVVEYRLYPGLGHLAISRDTEDEMAAWIAARFAGAPVAETCE
jgi:uncharacterized membrane protein HdeD (DUF308 family)/alpha-beta hydrolase superfamily lysophospholipase